MSVAVVTIIYVIHFVVVVFLHFIAKKIKMMLTFRMVSAPFALSWIPVLKPVTLPVRNNETLLKVSLISASLLAKQTSLRVKLA